MKKNTFVCLLFHCIKNLRIRLIIVIIVTNIVVIITNIDVITINIVIVKISIATNIIIMSIALFSQIEIAFN